MFLQSHQSYLETLNFLFLIVQKWASSLQGDQLLPPSKAKAILTRKVLSVRIITEKDMQCSVLDTEARLGSPLSALFKGDHRHLAGSWGKGVMTVLTQHRDKRVQDLTGRDRGRLPVSFHYLPADCHVSQDTLNTLSMTVLSLTSFHFLNAVTTIMQHHTILSSSGDRTHVPSPCSPDTIISLYCAH